MDLRYYRHYIEIYIREALANSDGTNVGISEYLSMIKPPGRFSSHKEERNRALFEVRKAFSEHRHWPLSIILSHLGVEAKDLLNR